MRPLRTIEIAILALMAGIASAQTSISSGGNSVNTATGTSAGVATTAASTSPDVTAKTGDSSTSAFRIFNSSNTELLRVQANGSVGIGVTSAGTALDVNGSTRASGGFVATGYSVTGWAGAAAEVGQAGGSAYLTGYNRTANTYVDTYVRGANVYLQSSGISRFNLDPNGNVTTTGVARFGYDFTTMPSPQYGGIQVGQYGAGGIGEIQFMSCGCGNGYGFRWRGDSSDASLKLDRRANSTTWVPVMTFKPGDSFVGIGTSSPNSTLQINTPNAPNSPARFMDTPGVPGGVSLDMSANGEVDVAGLRVGTLAYPNIQTAGGAGASPLYLNLFSDNDVQIGNASYARGLKVVGTGASTFAGSVTVSGNMTVNGTVYANYQDVAEWVPAGESMEAGTVVVLSADTANTVIPSAHAYDTGVAGVVSPSPGLLLGVASPSKAKIATTGRVKVRTDATRAPIHIGDLLVTSDKPGVAMRSEPIDVGGVKIHRPGTLIGKALEPLPGGEGEILVLLSLQ